MIYNIRHTLKFVVEDYLLNTNKRF